MITEEQLIAIKDAYWNNMKNDEDLSAIYDTLYDFIYSDIDYKDFEKLVSDNELIKKVFYSLPQYIIGKGISWGFCDTEVKDEIYIHIRDNKDLYKKIT